MKNTLTRAVVVVLIALLGAPNLLAQPAKGSALDIPTEPLTGCQHHFHPNAQSPRVGGPGLARSARLGPLCGSQRKQTPRDEPHSGPGVSADVWRAFVEKLHVGSTLKVRLKDGTRVKATLLQVSPEAMTIQPRTRIPVDPQAVPFTAIESLDVDRSNGIGVGKAIAIGVASAAGAFLGLLLITFALVDD